jgi:hypothetical protein
VPLRCAAVLLALTLAGCATPSLAPGEPRTVDRVVIAPYESHDQCMHLVRGDRVDWRYQSSEPLAFNIHYRDGNADLSPVVRERSTSDAGTFEAQFDEDYCLTWESGPPGAIIGYRILLRPAAR